MFEEEWCIKDNKECISISLFTERNFPSSRNEDCKNGLRVCNEGFLHHCRSKARSESSSKRGSASTISKALLLLRHKNSSSKTLPKCSECKQISLTELHRIRIDIHKNTTSKIMSCKLQKDINDLEDVSLGRKSGEGFKSTCKSDFKKFVDRNSSRSRSSYHSSNSRSFKNEIQSRKYREKSRDRSRESRSRSMGWRDSSQTFMKHVPVPVPVYYRNLNQSETMVQLQAPGSNLRGRSDPKKGPVRFFPSRFITPNIYRSGGNPNCKQTKIRGSVFYHFLLFNKGKAKSFDNEID